MIAVVTGGVIVEVCMIQEIEIMYVINKTTLLRLDYYIRNKLIFFLP